ncbi:hypothetical protein [Allomuricauda sp. SCSIO 65647]|uniref:hypothetical protein n=1 Tax=Allomuricauda sp. SCSIO 65647 TaxID=2908843 RepID=UPI001F1A28F4|nr:hypothetical protein [Muricauda sp. SCSIO 65647]UJH66758.1 hypothetical protein L0P89_12415 [Muricauda sp. SCSIO 65647]
MERTIFFLMLLTVVGAFSQTADCNCCSEAQQAFDFWVGEWIVTNADGTPAGKNSIVKEENGCVLRENWTSEKSGFTGTSLNFYNAPEKQWEQLWIDNTGNHLKLIGNRVDNRMVMTSVELKRPDGQKYRNRITWTLNKDGSVRQLWEVLKGDEVTSVAFDGLYKKVLE